MTCKQYDQVTDLDRGDQAYLGVRDVRAEAVVVSEKGSHTLTMTSFGFDAATYDRILRKMLDAILS